MKLVHFVFIYHYV